MSKKSLQIKLNSQTSNDDNRGGEKKVMKKSLSVLVATAMVSSIFASSVFADDQLTTQQKYDALIAAGVFDKDGTGNGAELDSNMSREQLAKILVKLKGLEEVSGTSYTDVSADRWSAGFIQAVSKANPFLMDGVADGLFNPSGDVTLEQLAVVAVRALGLQTNNSATVNGNVSDWAKGFVAAAIANGLLGQKSDYTKPAIRSELVEAAYAAKEVLEELSKPEQVSVASAKATGVKKIEVKFNRDVDTSKAKLTLKKGSNTIAATAKFAEDGKSAVLTLTEAKVSAGEYTVTLSGLAADAVKEDSASFTAEDETLKSLEFLNTNEYLAYTTKAIVKLKGVNQYGEAASVNPGEYNIYAGTNNDIFVKFTKNDDNELLLTLNTTALTGGAQQNMSVIPVNIIHNTSRISISKTFKLGTAPFIQKMELSNAKYSNGKDSLSNLGETVTFDVINYDQYGNLVPYAPGEEANTQINFNPHPFNQELVAVAGDSNGDEVTDIKISLVKNVDKADDYVVTVWNQAGMATTKISVKSAKVATKVTLGEPDDTIAAGDTEAYISLTAYDATGSELSVDDLVSDENFGRISISSSTGVNKAELIRAGEHKGKIKVTDLPTSRNNIVSVNASITTPNANSFDTKNYNIQAARYPEYIKVATVPAAKIVAGAESTYKFVVYDQYGKEYKVTQNVDNMGNATTATGPNISEYRVSVTASTYDANLYAEGFTGTPTYYTTDIGSGFNVNKKFKSTDSLNDEGYAKVTAVIERSINGGAWTPASTAVVREIRAVKANEELTYAVGAVRDLFNALDSSSVTEHAYGPTSEEKFPVLTQKNPTLSKFAREVTITAKDAAGNTVALPKIIQSIQTSNPLVAQTGLNSDSKGYVIGNKEGTATLTVSFKTNKNETLVRTVNVNVKSDPLTSTALTVGNKTRTMAQARTAATSGDAFSLMNVKVTDNYGVAYDNGSNANRNYNYLFGVVFSIQNVVGGNVSVDQYGRLTIDAGVTSFEITATTPTGKSATTLVSN